MHDFQFVIYTFATNFSSFNFFKTLTLASNMQEWMSYILVTVCETGERISLSKTYNFLSYSYLLSAWLLRHTVKLVIPVEVNCGSGGWGGSLWGNFSRACIQIVLFLITCMIVSTRGDCINAKASTPVWICQANLWILTMLESGRKKNIQSQSQSRKLICVLCRTAVVVRGGITKMLPIGSNQNAFWNPFKTIDRKAFEDMVKVLDPKYIFTLCKVYDSTFTLP